jgi:hypothetical protein
MAPNTDSYRVIGRFPKEDCLASASVVYIVLAAVKVGEAFAEKC